MDIEIIAELAQGFEGSKDQALLLVKAAAKSGASAAKFQLIYADELATPDYEHYELFSSLEMVDSDWFEVKELCDAYEIELIFDVFGSKGLRLAEKLQIKTIKLHATDINNIGFLSMIAKSSIKRVMLGAGGAFSSEIMEALEVIKSKNVVLFHGFQGYPTSMNSNQLSRIAIWKNLFDLHKNITFGFSDHVDPEDITSVSLPSFAVGLGVTVLEKHLTLGRCMELEDHEVALNPDQFKIFTNSMKDIALATGESTSEENFGMTESELNYRKAIRRHVVATRNINSGDHLSKEDVALKRTSNSNAITNIKDAFSKTSVKDILSNQPITKEDIK